MTMQKTYNRRRRYLLSRNIRRNPWTNRGWTLAKFRGCIEETINVIISRTVACGPTPSRIEMGSIAHIHRYLWELRQHRKKLFPQEASVSYVDTNSGPYKSDLFSQELANGSEDAAKE